MPDAPRPGRRLGLRLRRLRQDYGAERKLTQPVLGQVLGIGGTTISSYEHGTITPPDERLWSYATFFAVGYSAQRGFRLPTDSDLSDAEQLARDALYAELLELRDSAPLNDADPVHQVGAIRRIWRFDDGAPVRLVCGQLPGPVQSSMAETSNPNYTELLSYADLDAMVELFGHVRAENPDVDVRFRRSEDLIADDLSSHVVLLGGLAWNQATQWFAFRSPLPAAQIEDPAFPNGEIFEVDRAGAPERFYPVLSDDPELGLIEDVGFFVRIRNPYNRARTLTVCNGVHSRGVLGAVRCFTDAHLRRGNEAYVTQRFGESAEFGVLMRVPVMKGRTVTPELADPYITLYEWPEGT